MESNAASKENVLWTPELIIQAFKELVTAILGIAVVVYTLILGWSTFSYVGGEQKMIDAKDVLILMLGLAGVVVGYYFGRMPADARAAQAQDSANDAIAKSEKVNAHVQVAVNKVEQIIDKIPQTGTRGTSDPLEVLSLSANLLQIRDELRTLINVSNTIK